MQQKMSVKSWEFSLLKFGQCPLKYSSLVFLTRLKSQPKASWWLCVNALCRSVTSCHFELGGPSGVALDVVLLGAIHPPDLERDATTCVWVNAQV